MKKYLIYNTLYLPIAGTNKYVKADMNGNVYLSNIYTLKELLEIYSRDKNFKTCNNIKDIVTKYNEPD